ncbi:hypothetical protein KC19_8G096100 [Ceratodon purpureus]|uniref:DUF4378 domain-containing protein n=1 Tax=Ceratodon purpureus TaxID=3225 RepID=A0A8T0H567_CERPU|nr:hypothetical protein KC19_8G096100 [Ceratodon purpureus]
MPSDMAAEDSAELLKNLEENRRTLQKQIGCLAGILQIFDRQRCLTGRRFGSHRTSTSTHEDAASIAYGSDVLHEPGSPLTYHKSEGQHAQLWSKREENRGSAVVEERVSFSKEEEALSLISSDFVTQTSRISVNETPQTETPAESRSPRTPVTATAPRRTSTEGRPSFENFCRSPDSALIRNVVVNSLHKEKPRVSVDNSNREVMAGLIRLKNLARSRSVGGRNGYSRTSVEFPRSSSLSAQRSSGIYKDGNEAMCVEDAPELLAREKVASNLTHLRRSINGSETHRLTVELEEGPGVGTKKLQRTNSHNYYERDAARQAVMNLDKSLAALDLKESFRALQREKSTRRSFVDKEQTSPAEVFVTPSSCVDGRKSPSRELPSSRDEQEGRRSNVVARLMGLEEFSCPPTLRKDCKEAGSINAMGHGQQRRGRSLSPKHRLMDGMPSPLRQQEAREALKSKLTKSMKHFYDEGPLLTLQGCKTPSPTLEPLHGDIIQRFQQLRSRNSAEERETLNQILETLQFKGLLHSPQRKSSGTPEFVRQRSANAKHTSEQSCRESMAERKIKHEETNNMVMIKPTQEVADCKFNRSECSERSEATTGTRLSNEDGGSTKPGRGRSRSPVRTSKSPLRSNNDVRSTSQVSAHPIAVTSPRMRSNPSATSGNNARSPHVKQVLQGQVSSHLRDKRESKTALVTVRGTQSHEVSQKNHPVSDAKPDGTIKNCETQPVKSSTEVRRQKRPIRTTSRDAQSPVPRALSPGPDCDHISSTTLETIADTNEPSSFEGSVAATQTSTNDDSCVDQQTSSTTPAKIREKLQTLKDQKTPLKDPSDVKESSELMTLRAGFQVENISPALEKSGQGSEGCEQRSPVSVLDNSIFEDDGSPSPMPADNLQDSFDSNDHDHLCHEVRLKNASMLATTSLTSVDTESGHNATCAWSGDNERDFVEEFLMLSGISKHVNSASGTLSSRNKIADIYPDFLVYLKEDLRRASDVFFQKCHNPEQSKQMNMLNRQALIDYVYELMAVKMAEYENTLPWLGTIWVGAGQEFKRQNLVHAIWKELQELPSAPSDDICDTVQRLLQEDLSSRGAKWTGFRAEIGEVGVEVEKLIYRDLMDEVVKDLQCSGSSRYSAKLLEGGGGPRRQLFAL